jgi:hypothetical protein
MGCSDHNTKFDQRVSESCKVDPEADLLSQIQTLIHIGNGKTSSIPVPRIIDNNVELS